MESETNTDKSTVLRRRAPSFGLRFSAAGLFEAYTAMLDLFFPLFFFSRTAYHRMLPSMSLSELFVVSRLSNIGTAEFFSAALSRY